MKKALIMGINGGFGANVAQALGRSGWSIKTMLRNPSKRPQTGLQMEIVPGNAARIEDIRCAAENVNLLIYGVNPANYRWDDTALPWLDNALTVAEEKQLTFVFPGNVYVFDPADGPEFNENSPHRPITTKGDIRHAMEQRLKIAADKGARIIIIRMGDFIAADAPSSWLPQLIKPTKNGYTLSITGLSNLSHTWAYLPDVGATVAELVEKTTVLPMHSVFHFRGYRATFNQLATAIHVASGKNVRIRYFPWWLLKVAAPFSNLLRSLLEMRYLWQNEVSLSDDKLRSILNKPLPHTPLAEALLESGLAKP